MQRGLVASFIVVGIGCGSGSSPPRATRTDAPFAVLERSGSRLQARGYEADGLFVFDGFFDTQLGVACDRGKASDGSDRCVPRPAACPADPAPPAHEPAELVAFTSTSEVPLATGITAIVANGEDGSRVSTGELVDQGRRCTITPLACGTPETNTCPTPLVDGQVAHGSLREKTKATSDGTAVARSAVIDPNLGGPCRFTKVSDGSVRCVPSDVATIERDVYADPACSRPLFKLPPCDAKYIRYDEPGACGTIPRFFFMEPLAGQMFQKDEEACVAAPARADLVALGDELPSDRLRLGQPATR